VTISSAAPTVATAIARLPTGPGVYRFRDERGRALYIGRAVDLRRRVRSYWGSLRGRRHLARMVAQIDRVEAVACASEHEAAWLERNLLEHRKPYWNRVRGGQEVPVYIRLDERRNSADLTVVHTSDVDATAVHFGPYLGGLKVRLAVSALHRVLSLAYAADRLTGSEADLARVRGVGPAGRDALVRTAVAVLNRDPVGVAALRDELVRRREQAAGALLFELAGRIQAELEAVDWVVAPQRATTAHHPSGPATDADLHGYCGGLLVSFTVREGRLREWNQRTCSPESARLLVAATPPVWADFAQRNAELAALLLRGTV
jgi:excinuclease ABC subunit C